MKKTIVLSIYTSLLAAAIFIPGCATPQYSTVPAPSGTPPQQVIVTNIIAPPPTAPAGTPPTVQIVTNLVPVTTVQIVTNYAPNSTLETIASTTAAIAPLVPAPYSLPLEAGGWLLGAIGVAAAGYLNAKRVQHLSTLQAVTTGIETALPQVAAVVGNNLPQAAAALSAVKTSITAATSANGTQTNLQNVLSSTGLG